MARLRTRAKRTAYLLVALAILFLLLELNRFLPGTWPGGGGGGFRQAGRAGAADPRVGARPEAPPGEDATAPDEVEPPERPPADWPPREGLRIEVRGPDGDQAAGWRLGRADAGSEDGEPGSDGTLRTQDKRLVREGFRVRSAGGLLRHRHGVREPAARWSVYLPAGRLPVPVRKQEITVRVVDPGTGAPVVGARVTYRAGGADVSKTTDARGEARVRPEGAAPFDARIRAEGRVERRLRLSAQDPVSPEVALDEVVEVEIAYAPSQHAVLAAAVVFAGGRGLRKADVTLRGDGVGQQARARVPRAELDEAWLETIVGTPDGSFVFRRPLRRSQGGPVEVPAARRIAVRVRDPQGGVVRDAKLRAVFATWNGPEAEDEPRGTSPGVDGLPLPAGDGAHVVAAAGAHTQLLVDPAGGTPVVRALTPVDGSDTLDFVAEKGLRVPVRVVGAGGKPLAGARVVARQSIDGMRVVREARTGADGRAEVGTFARGDVEVFAQARGHAAAAQVVRAAGAMATVAFALPRGHPIRLVVGDPFGRPLADVDVEVTPSDGGAPLVVMPGTAGRSTDERGGFVLPAVPDGRYDIALTAPGRSPQKLRRVRPGAVQYFATMLKAP